MLRRSLLLLAVVACSALASVVVSANLSLDYTTNVVLENAILDTSYQVTSEFTDAVATVVKDSLGASTLSVQVYPVYPHLILSTEYWSTGTSSVVETAVHTMNTTYQGLAGGGSAAMDVSGKLSYICMTAIGQQPTVVNYTNTCSFWQEAMPPSSASATCLRNLSVSIYTNSSNATAMREALCSILPTDCNLITNTTATSATVPIGGTTVNAYVMAFTITSEDREATLALLVAYATYASLLVEQRIVYILVNGVRVFYQGDMQQLWVAGTPGQCVNQMWYLIFLIILVPVILILSQQLWYWGRASGKRSIKGAEQDIRAGVQRSVVPWGGFQYGPPQAYGGGFGGGNEGQQMGPPFQQQGGAAQQPPGAPPGMGAQGWGAPQQGVSPWNGGGQQWGGMQHRNPSQPPGMPGSYNNNMQGAQWPYSGGPPQPNANQRGAYGGASAPGWWGQSQQS